MQKNADLDTVLSTFSTKVDTRKLTQLRFKLRRALDSPLSSQTLDDPILVRRYLVEYMRHEGASSGVIHSYEQFFMGIVRRAALEGLIPAPTEGPWTRDWQAVLDLTVQVRGSRAPLRSLAGWATAHGLSPEDVEMEHILAWANDMEVEGSVVNVMQDVLASWSNEKLIPATSDTILIHRLQSKAKCGTVKSEVIQ